MSQRTISPEDWRPRGIANLEPAAWAALRREGSTSVVAGPGAGKTEFLAQRAAYLLETGLCKAPKQILAISFKTDAAANLSARVRKRMPLELSGRFTSLTFDAFTKSLVDRFLSAIPQMWRPSSPYEISFPTRRQIEAEMARISELAQPAWKARVGSYSALDFETVGVGGYRLPVDFPAGLTSADDFAVYHWLHGQLHLVRPSKLTFITLNRLAELIVRANPKIACALRMTYPYVFVDEFQDTSYAQYDFLLSTFGHGESTVTAVGDHKQRIMGWAGARQDVFEKFEADFHAKRENLLFNFRSSPELVRVQHFVAEALDRNTPQIQSQAAAQLDRDVVQVWNSKSPASERQCMAGWIAADMAARGKKPTDYVLLVRQRADDFESELQPAFAAVGLSLRNESRVIGKTNVQDLMVDDAASTAIAALRLAAGQRSAAAWSTLSSTLYAVRGADEEDELRRGRADRELQDFLGQLGSDIRVQAPSKVLAVQITRRVFEFLGISALKSVFMVYTRNDLLEVMIEAFSLHLQQAAYGAATWDACIDRYMGTHDIPLMTVHKSKGLEYDTVFFIGLDDNSWWSHTKGNPDGIATFFVALSRAKQRAIFLFCAGRGSRDKVSELFDMLTRAGIVEVVIP